MNMALSRRVHLHVLGLAALLLASCTATASVAGQDLRGPSAGQTGTESTSDAVAGVAEPQPERSEDLAAGDEGRSTITEFPGPVIARENRAFYRIFDVETGHYTNTDFSLKFKSSFDGRSGLDRLIRNGEAVFGIVVDQAVQSATRIDRTISLVRVDLASGESTVLADLGNEFNDWGHDPMNDEYFVEAATNDHVLVSRLVNGGGRADWSFLIFDARSGELTKRLDEFEACGGTPRDFYEIDGDRVVAESLLGFVLMDLSAGSLQPLGSCEDLPSFGEYFANEPLDAWITTSDGNAPHPELVAQLRTESIDPWRVPIIGAEGDLWWVTVWTASMDDQAIVIAAVVRYDVDRGEVAQVWPGASGIWMNCDDTGAGCFANDVSSIGWSDGQLVIAAGCCQGAVAAFNPSTGEMSTVPLADELPDSETPEIIDHPADDVWMYYWDRRDGLYHLAWFDSEALEVAYFAPAE